MNGFADHGLDEGAFGEKTGGFRKNIRTFDAFRKSGTSPIYTIDHLKSARGVLGECLSS